MKSVKLLCLAIVTVPVIAGSQQNVTPSMTVISAVAPVYPGVALALRHGGKAVIEVTVNPQGNVVDAKPLEGSRLLYEYSIKAAKRWTFSRVSREQKLQRLSCSR